MEAAAVRIKICTTCGVGKPATEEHFYSFAQGKFGLHPRCRECTKAYMRRRTAANRKPAAPPVTHKACIGCGLHLPIASFALRSARGKREPGTRCVACAREYGRRVQAARYERNAPAMNAAAKAWKAANREKADLAVRRWLQNHPEARNAIRDKYRARQLGAEGSYSKGDVRHLLNLQARRCFYCGEFLKEFHVDHFIPLSRGGTNWPDNIVLACGDCNRRKHDALPWHWMPERFEEGCKPRG